MAAGELDEVDLGLSPKQPAALTLYSTAFRVGLDFRPPQRFDQHLSYSSHTEQAHRW
jgi:hypothetical protein